MSTFRQVCRACNSVCFVQEGTEIPDEGYRCEACENANYERYSFDKSLPHPEPADPFVQPSEDSSAPDSGERSEARPSAEPKSPDVEESLESQPMEVEVN